MGRQARCLDRIKATPEGDVEAGTPAESLSRQGLWWRKARAAQTDEEIAAYNDSRKEYMKLYARDRRKKAKAELEKLREQKACPVGISKCRANCSGDCESF
jgi:hypothetical protein